MTETQKSSKEIAYIEGYASIFNEPDLNGDVIIRGAFGKKFIPAAQSRAKMLYQHKAEEPIGVWTDIYEDQKGLFVRGYLILDNDLARNVWHLLRSGALDGLSIGFKTLKSSRLRKGRKLSEIDLWEISIVTFPMAPEARITAVGEREPSPGSGQRTITSDQPLASLLRSAKNTFQPNNIISV